MIDKQFPKKRVRFFKRAHKYVYDKETELSSVTSWIKSFFAPFDEQTIACATAASRRKKGDVNATAFNVLKEWKKSRTDGSSVHKEIEDYINNAKDVELLKAKSAIAYLKTLDASYTLFPEQLLYDAQFGLAGTTDLIAQNTQDGTLVIIDWKTNKSIYQKAFGDKKGTGACSDIPDCNYWHYYIQLSTYAYLLSLKGHVVNKCVLVHLKEDKYETYEVIPSYSQVEKMLKEKNGHQLLASKQPQEVSNEGLI